MLNEQTEQPEQSASQPQNTSSSPVDDDDTIQPAVIATSEADKGVIAPQMEPDQPDEDATQAIPQVAETIQVPPMIAPEEDAQISPAQAGATPEPASTAVQPALASPSVTPRPAGSGVPAAFFSAEDLVQLQLAGEPQVSPDGLLVAYTVLRSDLVENNARATLWLVAATPAANGKNQLPRQLTLDTSHATAPRWSPDGRTLAFLSDRSGSLQIYLLPLNGGEARQVSFLPQAVTEFSWRPDGRAFLVQSPWKADDDQPDTDDESVAQVWTRLDETWDGPGYKHGRQEQLWLLDLENGQTATRLTFEPENHIQACWSPDGKEIAFCVNRRTEPDLSASAALWVFNLATGRMRRLSPIDGLAQQPTWSPDGCTIAYYFAADQSETANVVPWIVGADGQSAPRPATVVSPRQTSIESLVDNLHLYTVSRPCWYPDNTSLLVTVQAHGQVHLNRLYINTNHEEPLTTGNGCYLSPHMSANGRTIAALRTDWFTPGDIWLMAGNGVNRRRLTSVNDALMRNRQLIRPKKVTWRSFDNLEIEGWLYLPVLPPGTRAPLVLDVHGGPTLAWAESYVHDFQVLAGLGYAVLAANPRGSAGYGEEFCRKIINDWGGDDYRDLMLGLDHLIATEPIDASRLAITGASYGGYMTCWALTQSKRFKAGVARNPVTSLVTCSALSDQWLWFSLIMGNEDQNQDPETLRRSCSPLTFADAITTPLLLIHSTDDLRCPPSESKQLFNVLRRRQHKVELALYPGVSHLLDFPGFGTPRQRVDRLNRSIAWFRKYV
jgi:dipeptidyl aminopeptidase/acylaminoacyl peptidase